MSISCPNKPLQENRWPEHNFSAWNLEKTLSVTKSLTGGLEPFASCQDTNSFPTPGDKWPCPQWNCQESIISWTEFSFPARCPTPKPHIVCSLVVMIVGKGQSRKCHTRYLSLFLLFHLGHLILCIYFKIHPVPSLLHQHSKTDSKPCFIHSHVLCLTPTSAPFASSKHTAAAQCNTWWGTESTRSTQCSNHCNAL